MQPTAKLNKLMHSLNYLYAKSLSGIAGLDSAEHLARQYQHQPNLSRSIDQLIRHQIKQSAGVGFLTGLGGILTLPLSLPANLSAIAFVQIRMICAIAYLCGHDPKDEQVQTLVYAALCGNSASDLLKKAGIHLGRRLSHHLWRHHLSTEVSKKIQHTIANKLLHQASQAGLIKATTLTPLIGGLVSGSIDAATTGLIGRTAKHIFYQPGLTPTDNQPHHPIE